ncbi:MAG: Structural maintenance of chromosomes protein 5 [Phylliscum demangeonii]|nr:MAG: Structural maintenance of chromosomes protein 5 [Phylliscum demangeonii]
MRRRRLVESDEEREGARPPPDRSGSGGLSSESPRSPSPPPPSSGQASRVRKRVRLDSSVSTQRNGDGLPTPESARSREKEATIDVVDDMDDIVAEASVTEHYQPGSIVRVKLQNFVTYTAAEFFPGPRLNMIIGPNGTGKSTLVCAICLGLGWGPHHLGRAKEVSEYVKHGNAEATIEIELAKRPGDDGGNPVIRRVIRREGNKSLFAINGKSSTNKSVLELAKSFSIQIDNLCQFLPQDKVCEFAALTPVELLHSTQRAAAPEHMLQWHDRLKVLRAEQKQVQAQQATDKETLANLESRQQMLRADVERLRERAAIQKKVAMLEKARPFAQYRQVRHQHQEAKRLSREAQTALKTLEEEVEPSLRAVNQRQAYGQQIEKVVKERKRAVERAETAATDLVAKQRELGEAVDDLNKEIAAEREGDKKRKAELARIEENIKRLEQQVAEVTVDFDPLVYNEQIREKQRAGRELVEQAQEVRSTANRQVQEGREKSDRIARAERQLADLDSRAGQQTAKLHRISSETGRAWEWIQEHQDMFEHRIYGPPIVECTIKDARYVDQMESLMQRNDLLTFTTQSRADFKKLGDQLYGVLKLAEINIRTSTMGLDQCRAPVSDERRLSYGFQGWALDFIDGPAPVLAMLCAECRLHQTGVTLADLSQRQYEALQGSPISNWVSAKSTYAIMRRREYGAGATSTRVRDVRRAQIWTDQPVDLRGKQELQMNIEGWTAEVAALKADADEGNEKVRRLRDQAEVIERERKQLEEEKAVKQKAYADYKALPTRLAQAQDKYGELNGAGSQVRERVTAIFGRIDAVTLEKGRAATEHAHQVADLAAAAQAHLEADVMLLEAHSDVSALTALNQHVKESLEQRRREAQALKRTANETAEAGKRLLATCQAMLAEEADDSEQRAFLTSLPERQTADDIEAEIEAERARLELVHEGSNPNAMAEFERREATIGKLRDRVTHVDANLARLAAEVGSVRDRWEPELDRLVGRISLAFGRNFEKIGCAGQVDVYKAEDFDHWAIQIMVKFRESEPLTQLTSHRQSGGERAVSTIFYLLALQALARAPFRVVDEINQGMDPRNERLVHDRLLDIACQDRAPDDGDGDGDGDDDEHPAGAGAGGQYFLITPKLLHGLRYHPNMRVLCIASGEYMPDDDASLLQPRKGRDRMPGPGPGPGSGSALLDFARAVTSRRVLKEERSLASTAGVRV